MATFKRILKLKRLYLLPLFPIAALLLYIAGKNRDFAEYVFARGIYRIYSEIFSLITGVFQFSLAEYGICLAFIAIPALIVSQIIVIIKRKGERLYIILRDFLTVAGIASLAGFMLFMGCTINYRRYTFAEISGLNVRDSSVEELNALCTELGEKASALREELEEDENGCFTYSVSLKEVSEKCRDAFGELSKDYTFIGGYYARPKLVIHSTFMSMTEFTGVFVPFTMEANVNIDVPKYSIASTMCHEMAHLHGFIREDEANYVAYLACMASGDKELMYSGLLEALIYSGNALAGKDLDAYSRMRAALHPGVNRDFAANNEYWAQFEDTVISNTADSFNDNYLKANDQEDGVQSYGRVVDLLLAEYRKNNGLD